MLKTIKKRKRRKRRRTKISARISMRASKNRSEKRPKKPTQGDTGSNTTVKGRRKNALEERRLPKKPRREPKSTRGNSGKSVLKETGSGRRLSASAGRKKSRKEELKWRKGDASRSKKPVGKKK